MDHEVRALTERVAQLEAERDIAAMLARYAHLIDYGRGVEWAECFTPDGRFEVRRPGMEPSLRVGREELTAFAAGRPPAPVPAKHFASQITIDVHGDTATAQSYFAILSDLDGVPSRGFYGRYDDEFVRDGDGRWRIASRVVEGESRR